MATTIAAMKATLGSTEYFILAMKAQELVKMSKFPSEMEGWHNLELEEREQREINYNRVRSQIAPYLVRDKDRFFGAIILTAQNFDSENFEPLNEVTTQGLPRLYKTQASLMGFLTFKGGEVLIPLDGQHRLKAIAFAIEGTDEKGKTISGISPSAGLANEDITVIIIPYDQRKSRKIFTKVNRYAKPTTTGQNLVTDDDDPIAVLSREIANDQNIIGARLVKYKSNTLTDKDCYFTTLATIADCNDIIISANFCAGSNALKRDRLPEEERMDLYRSKVKEVWEALVAEISEFSDMLEDKDESGDRKRIEIRKYNLLGKPIPQVCLVRSLMRLTNQPKNSFTLREALERLNRIDWSKENPLWDRLLLSGKKFLYKNKNLAAGIISYVAGERLNEESTDELQKNYRDLFPDKDKKSVRLPEKI